MLNVSYSSLVEEFDRSLQLREKFVVRDMVFVRLQSYRQMSLKDRYSHKLSPKYFGPFQKHTGAVLVVAELLVALSPHGYIILEPESILESRLVPKGSRTVTQFLIKWFNFPVEENTWMDAHSFKQQFPTFVLEDKDF
ncbi:hypothetical protein A4A49_59807 [Nicotiana attenuata]|uniref:Chromo domain-containing protein n=1 Tax=Nicotiana attenuata TaxID=49451 RepID=A0A1J6IYN8_NICAT|nr:hypothetical protein A4A49_59807 [Nicotiana attenuata]